MVWIHIAIFVEQWPTGCYKCRKLDKKSWYIQTCSCFKHTATLTWQLATGDNRSPIKALMSKQLRLISFHCFFNHHYFSFERKYNKTLSSIIMVLLKVLCHQFSTRSCCVCLILSTCDSSCQKLLSSLSVRCSETWHSFGC